MMETAEDWERDDIALVGALRGDRGLLAESLVRACGVVVADVLTDDALEVPVIEHQDGSRHSRRSEPRKRSQTAFMFGARTAVRTIRMPLARASALKAAPNLSSPSRIRNRGPAPEGVALRSCCVTQACDGKRVVAARTTLRVASSMNTNAKIERKNTS